MKNQYLTMEQAAKFCNLDYETFRYWVKTNRAPDFVMMGKRRFFLPESLSGWKRVDQRKNRHYK